jgi:hypothetical protein
MIMFCDFCHINYPVGLVRELKRLGVSKGWACAQCALEIMNAQTGMNFPFWLNEHDEIIRQKVLEYRKELEETYGHE